MKIVELVGIPGSGKSYILPEFKKRYNTNEKVFLYNDLISQFILEQLPALSFLKILPTKIQNKIFSKIYFSQKYDIIFQDKFEKQYASLIKFIKNYNDKRPIKLEYKAAIFKWFLKTGEYYLLSENVKAKGVLIIDEGFVQRVSSLFISELENKILKEDIVSYLKLIPKFSKLIYVERDFNLCLRSRVENPGYRLKGSDNDEIKKVLKINQTALTMAYSILKKETKLVASIVINK